MDSTSKKIHIFAKSSFIFLSYKSVKQILFFISLFRKTISPANLLLFRKDMTFSKHSLATFLNRVESYNGMQRTPSR